MGTAYNCISKSECFYGGEYMESCPLDYDNV